MAERTDRIPVFADTPDSGKKGEAGRTMWRLTHGAAPITDKPNEALEA
jgi:hypothetical protein